MVLGCFYIVARFFFLVFYRPVTRFMPLVCFANLTRYLSFWFSSSE